MKLVAGLVVLGMVVGCSDGGDPNPGSGAGAGAGGAQSGTAGGAGVATTAGSAGSPATGGSVSASGSAGSESAEGGGANIELPAGSREVDGVVNLVDAAAAAELEQFILDESLSYPTRRHSLNKSLNLFLEHYQELYDFVIFFTDHTVPDARAAAKFESVTQSAGPGGVSTIEIAAEGYETTGRVKAVIGVQYTAGSLPALAHEIAHEWAVDLDDKFGFGAALDAANGFPSHWGYSSVNGQLGGFDGSTLRCETPAGALPPNCTPLANGRTRYVTGIYAPQTNTFRGVPYAPLELYLMGLMPASEVPPTIQLLTDATFPEFDDLQMTATTEATGVTTLSLADIQARHGIPKLLPEGSRHFDAAFVVLSATPVAASVLTDVATWAAVFGQRKTVNGWSSFEEHTGGRATMNTSLDARRKVGTAPPAARAASSCDLVAQTCGRPELGCYLRAGGVCGLSGNLPLNAACSAEFSCARGLECLVSADDPDALGVCKPYCDPSASSTSAAACNTLCPGNFVRYTSEAGAVIAAHCLPD